jgi:hypothetical protein
LDAVADLYSLALANLQAEGYVLEDGHVLEGRVVLKDETDPALLWGNLSLLLFEDEDLAAILLL